MDNKAACVVLDPTGIYPIPASRIKIATEVEWLSNFYPSCGKSFWVQGQLLCAWTREWLRVWNKTGIIEEEKQDPHQKLASMIDLTYSAEKLDDKFVIDLVERLDSYPLLIACAQILAQAISDSKNVWFGEPSLKHLAEWLATSTPDEYLPIERAWQKEMSEKAIGLASYYRCDSKLNLLRRWIGLDDPLPLELGAYPLEIPSHLADEFDRIWESRILSTEGAIIDSITPTSQPGMTRIAKLCFKMMAQRTSWITRNRLVKLASYLGAQEHQQLLTRMPPITPEPLDLNSTSESALKWATGFYLPYRLWETVICDSSRSPVSEHLAESFETWMINKYPELKLDPVPNSALNYSVASLVQELLREGPVLWVVVDGLGWLDHLELLNIVSSQTSLKLDSAIEPRISIIPTKTEYAKWSLYAQLLPSDRGWSDDMGCAFRLMENGKRYTDFNLAKLNKDLRQNSHSLYCWDTEKLDSLYHKERDWQSLYKVRRPTALLEIARQIEYCVNQHPDSEQLRIVISSDHGQMMGRVELLSKLPEGLIPKGRMAIGRTDDERFAVLDRARYGLPHDISILRGAASLSASDHSGTNETIGPHGGLFPEEVVVGVSILRKAVKRSKVLVAVHGEGKANHPGELVVVLDNPNSIPLENLILYVNEIPELKPGFFLDGVPPATKISLKIPIHNWPELPFSTPGDIFPLSGELKFRFASAEQGSSMLDSESALIVRQMFRSGLNIDEFL